MARAQIPQTNSRNQLIELCRFIAAILIVCHHSDIFGKRVLFIGCWVFVEFFFMLTGYFTTRHFSRLPPSCNWYRDALVYVRDKLVRIAPYAWLGIALGFLVLKPWAASAETLLTQLLSLPFNLLFLKGSTLAIKSLSFDAPLWYLTLIMLFLPPIIVGMKRHENAYKYIICWLVPILMMSYNMETMGKVSVWEVSIGKMIRGASDLILGSLVYYISERLRSRLAARNRLSFVKILSIVVLALLCYLTITIKGGGTGLSAEITFVAFLSILLLVTDNRNITNIPLVHAITSYLGRLSMPVFCLHYPVEQMVQLYVPSLSLNRKLALSIAIAIPLSMIVMLIIDRHTVAKSKKQAGST